MMNIKINDSTLDPLVRYSCIFHVSTSLAILISSFQPIVFVMKMINNRRIPAFPARADQKSVGVKIDRQDRGVLEQNCLRLLKCGVSSCLITSLAGFGNKPIVIGI